MEVKEDFKNPFDERESQIGILKKGSYDFELTDGQTVNFGSGSCSYVMPLEEVDKV